MTSPLYDHTEHAMRGQRMADIDRGDEIPASDARITAQIQYLRGNVLKVRELLGMFIDKLDPVLIPLDAFDSSQDPTPGPAPKPASGISQDLDQINALLTQDLQRVIAFTMNDRLQL